MIVSSGAVMPLYAFALFLPSIISEVCCSLSNSQMHILSRTNCVSHEQLGELI